MLTYLHGDAVGSASLATSVTGTVVSSLRYYPYGGTRSGSMATDRRYTGQRWEGSVGFYDYGARSYDPALGRFLQADTIVPNPANPQSFNRYAYTLNSPVRYTDPSGHRECDSLEYGGRCSLEIDPFWVRFEGDWPNDYQTSVQAAAKSIGAALAGVMNGTPEEQRALLKTGDRLVTPQEAFRTVYGHRRIVFRHVDGDVLCPGPGCWAEAHLDWVGSGCSKGQICYDDSVFVANVSSFMMQQNATHELGHGIDQLGGRQARSDLADAWSVLPLQRAAAGFSVGRGWQQNRSHEAGEVFADMFLGWTYGRWDVAVPAGATRSRYMEANMPRVIWLAVAAH